MSWKTLTERDPRESNEVDPCDKDVWRSSVRSAMRAPIARDLEGSPQMWMMLLLLLHINLNADDDDDDGMG